MGTLIKVDSSMVYAVGYSDSTRELEVVFCTGKIWIYQNIPPKVYESLLKATSIGAFMLNNIIDYYKEKRVN